MPVMSLRMVVIMLCWSILAPMVLAAPASVGYELRKVNNIRAHVVTVNLQDQSLFVTPVLAYGRPDRSRSFSSFLKTHKPYAQITGSYFGVQSGFPVGDVVIQSRLLHAGPVGTALAITPDNQADFIDIPYRWRYSWPGYESVLQGGIRLVRGGKSALAPLDQGFRDPGLFRRTSRTAIGKTKHNKLLMVAVSRDVTLSELTGLMKGLGCIDAMTLDGGASTGLAYQGSVIVSPKRHLSNVLMVLARKR